MRTLLRIMKTELRVLFYSPIAWLILVVFSFLVGMETYTGFEIELRDQSLGRRPFNASLTLLASYGGVLSKMLSTLYLYIPLLTMGLMSRELSSGSIKLLYSSPISNIQIVLGKYFSAMVYCLILIAILLLPIVFSSFVLKDFDAPAIFSALLGVFLVISTYAAIGLFMSTITKYQVVAVIGTIAILSIFNYIGRIGQGIDIVRNITDWLSLSGRSQVFLYGMICSKDIVYFLLLIAMFLSFTVIKLQGERTKRTKFEIITKYGGVFLVVIIIGYITTIPSLIVYYDGTETKRNTLTENSQEVVSKLEGGLTIRTYVNILALNYHKGMPDGLLYDKRQFEKYYRFKPEIKMEYVYYYAKSSNLALDERYPDLNDKERVKAICEINEYDPDMFVPYSEIKDDVDLAPERFRFVRRLESENGNKTFLRIYNDMMVDPSEKEITVAMKTLVDKTPMVGFLTGHGERSISDYGERGYASFAQDVGFRQSLINQGFRVSEITFEKEIDQSIDVVIISDMKSALTLNEKKNYDDFIARGGNMVILGEPRRQDFMNPLIEQLGVEFMDGMLVQPTKEYSADVVVSEILPGALKVSPHYDYYIKRKVRMITPSSCALKYTTDKGFDVVEVLATSSKGVWNDYDKVDLLNDQPVLNENKGEVEKLYPTMIYLTRQINGKEQRIFVVGDSDCMSSYELSKNRSGIDASNFTLITETFRNLSYGEYPIRVDRVRPPDDKILLTQAAEKWIMLFFLYLIPSIFLAISIYILVRRKRR